MRYDIVFLERSAPMGTTDTDGKCDGKPKSEVGTPGPPGPPKKEPQQEKCARLKKDKEEVTVAQQQKDDKTQQINQKAKTKQEKNSMGKVLASLNQQQLRTKESTKTNERDSLATLSRQLRITKHSKRMQSNSYPILSFRNEVKANTNNATGAGWVLYNQDRCCLHSTSFNRFKEDGI